MNKRILIIFILFGLLFITGCNKNITNENEQRIIYTNNDSIVTPDLSLAYTNINLVIGDEYFINPKYNKLDGYKLSFESSNNNVSVNELGVIKANKPGSAEIIVTYSNGIISYSKNMTVNVSFGDYVPIIKVSNEKVTLELNDEYNLNPYVEFRNKKYSDAKFSFESLDESIATVSSNGIITANKNGKAIILVNATFKGKSSSSYPSLSTFIELSIVDSVRFYNGTNVLSDMTFYTVSSANNQEFDTGTSLDFKVQVNGSKYNAEYEILDDSLVNIVDNHLESAKAGSTSIRVYKDIDGKTYESTYKLNIIRPTITLNDTIPMFSIDDGMYYDKVTNTKKTLMSFIGSDEIITSAIQGKTELNVIDNKVFSVKSSTNLKRGEANIALYTDKFEYILKLETIEKVISTKEDLKYFELKDKDITGYFELSNNIDASDISIKQNSSLHYFSGVFNGCGYSISNLDISNSSLFGSLYTSSKIINLGLKNLNASNANYFSSKKSENSITIENVYIELSSDTLNPRGMFITSPANNVIKNVIIRYLGDNANKDVDYSLGGWTNQSLLTSNQYYTASDNLTTRTSSWKDVLVISPYVLGFRPFEKVLRDSGDNTDYAIYYYGVNEEYDNYNNPISNGRNTRELEEFNCNTEDYFDCVYNEVYHFKSLDELSSYGYDYSTFNKNYWTIENGIITWKN